MQEIDPGLLGVVVGFGPPPEIKGVAKWRLLWLEQLRADPRTSCRLAEDKRTADMSNAFYSSSCRT